MSNWVSGGQFELVSVCFDYRFVLPITFNAYMEIDSYYENKHDPCILFETKRHDLLQS